MNLDNSHGPDIGISEEAKAMPPDGNTRTKTVLVLSFYYFPNAFIASHRMAKLAKYLPRYGWRPRVVSAQWRADNCDMYDPGLLTESVRATILREIPLHTCSQIEKASLLRKCALSLSRPNISLQILLSRYTAKYSYVDPAEYYVQAASFVREYLKENTVDCILATCPARATLAVADRIHREFRIPWVADFRDTYDILMQAPSEKLRHRLLRQEPQVVASSSAIVTVSEALQQKLEARHERPVTVLYNGFDPEDFATIEPRKLEKFTVLYMGSVYYPDRDPRPLFKAVASLLANDSIDPSRFSVDFFCRRNADLNHLVRSYPGIERVVHIHETVPHRESIALQKGAHVLLHLAHGAEKGIMTGKLFEYLGARRPILCIPGDRDCVEETLRRTRAGVVCRNEEEVAKQMLCWYERWQKAGTVAYNGIDSEIDNYSRVGQAASLAGLLNQCVER